MNGRGAAASSLAAAAGALLAGASTALFGLQGPGAPRQLFLFGALLALLSALLVLGLSLAVEAPRFTPTRTRFGLHRSARAVLELSALFAVDSLAGGFIVQSLASYSFYLRFGADLASLGPIFGLTALANAASFLVAEQLAERFGLLRTKIFSHLVSNGLLILVPLAGGLLVLRETPS